MKCKRKGNLIAIRLFPGENLFNELINACRKFSLDSAVVLSGIGMLKEFELGIFTGKDYGKTFFSEPHELLSLNGNIAKQGNDLFLHLHAVLGNERMQVVGGHLFKAKCNVANEIFLRETPFALKREKEPSTGLMGLKLG